MNENVLILNGDGLICLSKVLSLGKKSLQLQVISFETRERMKNPIHVFLGVPKKDAFEDCVRFATELGVEKLVPVLTRYSQFENSHLKRINKIIEASLIQSNNPYFLEVTESLNFDVALNLTSKYTHRFAFSSMSKTDSAGIPDFDSAPIALWIGPEAGFEEMEEARLAEVMTEVVQMDGPIMTSPTAVTAAVGYIKGQLKRN